MIREIWGDLLSLDSALKPYCRPRPRGRTSLALEPFDRAHDWKAT